MRKTEKKQAEMSWKEVKIKVARGKIQSGCVERAKRAMSSCFPLTNHMTTFLFNTVASNASNTRLMLPQTLPDPLPSPRLFSHQPRNLLLPHVSYSSTAEAAIPLPTIIPNQSSDRDRRLAVRESSAFPTCVL